MSRPTESHTPGAPIALPEAKMHLYKPAAPALARVHRTEICTGPKAAGFVRHMEFDVTGTQLVGNCLPGQSIGVLAPGTDAKGRPHAVRLYSLASPTRGEIGPSGTRELHILSTTVKRTIDEHFDTHRLFLGVASNYLCDLHVGDELKLTGPAGKRFLIPSRPREHDYLFFATGTGIAPFRGMLIDLLEAKVESRIVLVMGSPYATDLLYDDFFRQMAAEHRSFTYLTAISRESQADGNGPMYVQGRLRTHRELLSPMLKSERTLIYICGIAGMELGIFQELARQLQAGALEPYLSVDPSLRGEVGGWTRQMVLRQIRPTKRVFLEVYE
jgi:ferredoxin--NADP+ reductase